MQISPEEFKHLSYKYDIQTRLTITSYTGNNVMLFYIVNYSVCMGSINVTQHS